MLALCGIPKMAQLLGRDIGALYGLEKARGSYLRANGCWLNMLSMGRALRLDGRLIG